MGCDKTEVWNVKLQRGLGILPSPIKSIDTTRTIGMYLPWATVFFFHTCYTSDAYGIVIWYFGPPLSCMHLSICTLGFDARSRRD